MIIIYGNILSGITAIGARGRAWSQPGIFCSSCSPQWSSLYVRTQTTLPENHKPQSLPLWSGLSSWTNSFPAGKENSKCCCESTHWDFVERFFKLRAAATPEENTSPWGVKLLLWVDTCSPCFCCLFETPAHFTHSSLESNAKEIITL